MMSDFNNFEMYPEEFSENEIQLLEYVARIPENIEKKETNIAYHVTTLAFSNYENILLRLSCIYSVKPAIMVDIFANNKYCIPRTAHSIRNHYDRTRHKADMLDVKWLANCLYIDLLSPKDRELILDIFTSVCANISYLNDKCVSAKLYIDSNYKSTDTADNIKKIEPIKHSIPTDDINDINTSIAKSELKLSDSIVDVLDSFDSNVSIYRFMTIAKKVCCRFDIFASIWNCSVEQAKNIIINFRDNRGIPIYIEPDGQTFRIVQSTDNDDYTANKVLKISVPFTRLDNGVEYTRIGTISDTHFGSDDCDIEKIEKFYHIATSLGVKTFVHSGDWLDGDSVYRGQKYALSTAGFEKQIDMVKTYYPYYDGVDTYGIMGNHDNDYMKASGSNPLKLLSMLRSDIHYVGNFQAYLDINGFMVNLHHPGGSCNKTKPEITLRNIVDLKNQHMRQRDIKFIDLCVVGHYHTRAVIETSTVRLAMFGGGFQKPTGLVRQFGLVPYEGGFIVTLYKLPDGTHRIEQHAISFDVY